MREYHESFPSGAGAVSADNEVGKTVLVHVTFSGSRVLQKVDGLFVDGWGQRMGGTRRGRRRVFGVFVLRCAAVFGGGVVGMKGSLVLTFGVFWRS